MRAAKLMSRVCVCVGVMVLLGSIFVVSAQESQTGKISVTKNDAGKVESITFTCDGESYSIAVSGKGKNLAKDADGETVEIVGKVEKKKDRKTKEETQWMNVKSYKVVFVGTVGVTKDEKKKITAITIGSTNVKVDSKSKKMAEKAEGKEVVAEGSKKTQTVGKGKDKEKQEIVVIKSYKLKEEDKK